MAGLLIVVLPGLAIAGWLAFLFIRKRQYEKGVIVFLSITLAPLLAWYFVTWVRDDSPLSSPIYDGLPGGFVDLMPGLAMVGTFVWLCVHWARKGQSAELAPSPTNLASPEDAASRPPPAAPEGNVDSSIRARLETLEQLRRDGLISEGEYSSKRAEILSLL